MIEVIDTMEHGKLAPLRLRLDGNALVANWQWLAAQSGAASCGAAVKANAYGLGARDVVARLSAAGCRDFFVAHWGEAAAIADLVPPNQIAVLNGFDADDPIGVLNTGAVPVLNTPSQIERWKAANGGMCHVMLDSGINRLGIGPEQTSEGLFDGLEIDIILSHLASADEDVPQNHDQLELFRHMSQHLNARRRSMANSAGIMLGADFHFNLTRPGLALYGGIAHQEQQGSIKTVVGLQAMVLQVRELAAGSPVGYNATHHCDHKTRVATLAVGYADGYWRGFSSKGTVWFEGFEMPVLGRVSMDLLTVDASGAPPLKEGDWVDVDYNLIGASQLSGMSQYELLTGLGRRAERIWM